MSPDLAVIVLGALYALAGFGLLALAGLRVSGAVDFLKLLGLAYLLGLVATSVVLIALLCIGLPLSIPWLVVISVLFGVGGVLVAEAVRGGSPATTAVPVHGVQRTEWRIAALVLGVLAGYLLYGFEWAKSNPLVNSHDAWAMWIHKGYLLYVFGHLPTAFFTSSAYVYMHQNYPMLVPVMDAVWFHLAGFDTVALHAQYWALYCSALWALGYAASRRARPLVWVPLLALFAVIPNVIDQLISLEADIPMALLLMLSVLWLGDWISTIGSELSANTQLALATLLLAGAANTKDEGMTGAVAVLLGAWAIVLISRAPRARIKALAVASVAFGVMLAPWQFWLAAHHIAGDIPLGKGLDPIYVADHMSRFGPSITAFYKNALTSGWDGAVPVAVVVLALCCFAGGSIRREALFYVVAAVLNLVAIIWVYIISPINLTFQLQSANRTVDGFVLTACAATIALCGRLLPAGPIALKLPSGLKPKTSLETTPPS